MTHHWGLREFLTISVFPRTLGAVEAVPPLDSKVATAKGSEVPLKAPATFLSFKACRDSSNFIVIVRMQ